MHEQAIVTGDDTTPLVEHGGIDATLHNASAEQLLHLIAGGVEPGRRVPSVQFLVEQGFLGVDHPSGPERVWVQRIDDNVGIATGQPSQHLGGVLAELHAEAHPERVGKVLAERVVGAQAVAPIVIVGLRAAQREDDHLP